MAGTLENLLIRLRDGAASAEDVDRARVLVRSDARLPEELRTVVLADDEDLSADAAGLLVILGAADPLAELLADAVRAEGGAPELPRDTWDDLADALRDGLQAEAGEIDVAEAVGQRVGGWAWSVAVADAVRAEAGEVPVDAAVLAELELTGPPVADAVRAFAGTVDVADAVMTALGFEAPAVRDAVVAEAGAVDVVARVMAEVAPAPVVELRPAASAAPVTPTPANDARGWTWAGVALAAVALVAVVVGQLGDPFGAGAEPAKLLFAKAGEVVVEDLSYGDDVQVFQTEGEQGAVIIWVDEEA